MAVDKEGFIRPQIGWSIHLKNSTDKAKAAAKTKEKVKTAMSLRIPGITA